MALKVSRLMLWSREHWNCFTGWVVERTREPYRMSVPSSPVHFRV